MKAEQIVNVLLEAVDPKEYVDTPDDVTRQRILALLDQSKLSVEDVNGVEVYNVRADADGYEEHVDRAGHPNKWAVSIHTTSQNHWLIDYDDYNSPQDAVAAGELVHKILTRMLANAHIHFIDEVSPV
jgi:hypothetical protein